MKIKTSDLIGKPLDYAVEQIELARMRAEGETIKLWWADEKAKDPSPYSTDWLLAGPIIGEERIELIPDDASTDWLAQKQGEPNDTDEYPSGTTPLIAAMRCYIASKLGDEVEIPEELA